MSLLRPLALAAALLLLAPLAAAQDPAPATSSIQRQMTPEQFKAAGLDKLTAQELANLDAWLNRTLDVETTRAAAQAEERVKDENRGFFHFGSEDAIQARLQGPFNGFRRGQRYVLDNGQVWQQTDNARLEGVKLDSPTVKITPRIFGNVWQLKVEGYNKRAEVERIK